MEMIAIKAIVTVIDILFILTGLAFGIHKEQHSNNVIMLTVVVVFALNILLIWK